MQELAPTLYQAEYVIASPLSANTPITLPSAQTFNGAELKVYLDGQRSYHTYDYTYVGSAPYTQIEFTFDIEADSVVLFEIVDTEPGYSAFYVVNTQINSGTPVTLPNSETYQDDELKIYVDGRRQYPVYDFNYEGSPPRTQVSFTYNIAAGSIILFEKEAGA